MKKKFALSALFILGLFINATFINTVSAETSGKDSAFSEINNVDAPQASTTIVIAQVYGGGGSNNAANPPTYKNDYVVLLNVSSTPQSLNGLVLQYGSATGNFGSTATNIFALPNVTLQPGQYFFVQLGTSGTAGADFPITPDATTTNLSMSAASGKVALTNVTEPLGCGATATPCTLPDSRIIDLVAYGDANNAEGGAPANNGTALTSVQGVVRRNNGCQDTDNNNNDFNVVTNPVPLKTSSPLNVCGAQQPGDANVDFNGDGRSDWVVTRTVNNNMFWWINYNGLNTIVVPQWGLGTDIQVPEDYDGDGKDDVAVWRPDVATQAAFYILQSKDFTVRIDRFGQTGDDPRVVTDYDGDGRADPAVYRRAAGGQNFFFYRGSANNPNGNVTFVPWGSGTTVRPNVGDYDGDDKGDFVIYSSNGVFSILRSSNGAVEYVYWGNGNEILVPGDYDGDGRDDFALVRRIGGPPVTVGQYFWYILERDGGGTGANGIAWGRYTDLVSDSDVLAPGDYDGDGRQDLAVWRPNTNPAQNFFWVRRSSDPTVPIVEWGMQGDYPAANWYVHP
ncbi:MAG TPA: lamin tail domain-containing protein [Pyrinomonadaceae bacterium]|nr:lamin tail domain-containing protein [Pyrinomonadaceae bacterium]